MNETKLAQNKSPYGNSHTYVSAARVRGRSQSMAEWSETIVTIPAAIPATPGAARIEGRSTMRCAATTSPLLRLGGALGWSCTCVSEVEGAPFRSEGGVDAHGDVSSGSGPASESAGREGP